MNKPRYIYCDRKGIKYRLTFCSESYELVKNLNLNITNNGYVITRFNKKLVLIHRLIMGVQDKGFHVLVDHKNGDKLDNRKSNLRICNKSQNERNAGMYKNNTSGFKGVYINKYSKKNPYIAYARDSEGKKKHIGCFSCPIEAAKAYNEYVKDNYGEFARLNDV